MARYHDREKMVLMEGVTTSEGAGLDDGAYFDETSGVPMVTGFNEGGYNSVSINLAELILWLRANHPEILEENS